MTMSDEDLRRALADRVAAIAGGGPIREPSVIARGVATSPPIARRFPGAPRFGRSRMPGIATVIGGAVIGIALVASVVVSPRSATVATGSPNTGGVPAATTARPGSPTPSKGGASAVPSSLPGSIPIVGCAPLGFSPMRCVAVVGRAREQAIPPLRDEDVTSATVAPPPPRDATLGSHLLADVRFDLIGGGTAQVIVRCVGIPGTSDRACNGSAVIAVRGGIDHDVPCTGEAPDGCATPPPSPRPASEAGAVPLSIAVLDIPLDRVGHYEIPVGAAGLPDGVLRERSARLAVDSPTTFWIDDGVGIDVRPDEPGRPPIGSIYRDAFDGVEPVHVFLVFDVVEVQPGAVLQVRDLIVR